MYIDKMKLMKTCYIPWCDVKNAGPQDTSAGQAFELMVVDLEIRQLILDKRVQM
jgi:hypothetical protein